MLENIYLFTKKFKYLLNSKGSMNRSEALKELETMGFTEAQAIAIGLFMGDKYSKGPVSGMLFNNMLQLGVTEQEIVKRYESWQRLLEKLADLAGILVQTDKENANEQVF